MKFLPVSRAIVSITTESSTSLKSSCTSSSVTVAPAARGAGGLGPRRAGEDQPEGEEPERSSDPQSHRSPPEFTSDPVSWPRC